MECGVLTSRACSLRMRCGVLELDIFTAASYPKGIEHVVEAKANGKGCMDEPVNHVNEKSTEKPVMLCYARGYLERKSGLNGLVGVEIAEANKCPESYQQEASPLNPESKKKLFYLCLKFLSLDEVESANERSRRQRRADELKGDDDGSTKVDEEHGTSPENDNPSKYKFINEMYISAPDPNSGKMSVSVEEWVPKTCEKNKNTQGVCDLYTGLLVCSVGFEGPLCDIQACPGTPLALGMEVASMI